MIIAYDVDLLHYYPQVLKDIKELQKICEAENPEIKLALDGIVRMYNNQFIELMDEYGCERWEGILNITPMSSDTLEDRRFRIMTKLRGNLPYTWLNLKKILNDIVEGDNEIDMSYDMDNFRLTVKIALTSTKHLDEVKKLLEEIVPANIILDVNLQFNTHGIIRQLTHEDINTGAYTHKTLRTEVIE